MESEHLFIASSDGALYDTRVHDWHKLPALRPVYQRTYTKIRNAAQFKATLRAGGYAWPGGYPLYFMTSDGGTLSFESARKNAESVFWSIANRCDDGWRVVACDINYEDPDLYCDHSGERIESAYGESDEDAARA